MSVMSPDPRPDYKLQLPLLPDQYSAATVSIPDYKGATKLILRSILKKFSNKNNSTQQLSHLHSPNHLRG